MEYIIKNTEFNINSLLINWGMMSGYLHDGMIERTTFGLINEWFSFVVYLFGAIKWSILISISQQSHLANLFGDFAYFYGPRIIINWMSALFPYYIITVKMLLIFISKHPKKMFYWIEVMEYDDDNDSFTKLNLNQVDSKMFIKRLSLSLFLLKIFTYLSCLFFIFVNFVCFFKYQNTYHLYYFISTLCFLPQIYFHLRFALGFLVILYPVSNQLLIIFKIFIILI